MFTHKKIPLWPFVTLDCLLIALAFYCVLFTNIPYALFLGLAVIFIGTLLLIFPVVHNHRIKQAQEAHSPDEDPVIQFEEDEEIHIDLHLEEDEDENGDNSSPKA